VLVTGGALAVGALALTLRRLDPMDVPRVAILAAMFFVVSLIAIPLGPTSVHPLLGGLMGLVLGPGVVPAVAVGLLLQALFFGFGGITSLGVNIVNIAGPGLLAGWLGGLLMGRAGNAFQAGLIAACVAALAVAMTGAMVALSLLLSSGDFAVSARVIILTYLPLMAVEGILTGVAVAMLRQARPDLVGVRAVS
jgi:cobalt/nickel transport system permease protein